MALTREGSTLGTPLMKQVYKRKLDRVMKDDDLVEASRLI